MLRRVDYPGFPGSWVWWCHPRALRFVGGEDKTYLGWVDAEDGDILVGAYDHNDDAWDDPFALYSFADDHATPALLIRDSDSKIMAFYTEPSDTAMRLRVSSNAEDISALRVTNKCI